MNLVQNRRVNPEQALRRAYPRAIKVGVDVAVPKASGLHDYEALYTAWSQPEIKDGEQLIWPALRRR